MTGEPATVADPRARRLGPGHRSPHLVTEEILTSARFRTGLDELRSRLGAEAISLERAGRMLDELSTGWSRLFADLVPRLGRLILRRGFDLDFDYAPGEVERLRATLAEKPAVLLWSHRSYLDPGVLAVAMADNGLPPAHLFGGINMALGPLGPTLRRAGVIFIRRTVDDPLYRYVLHEFVGHLVEQRFHLSWAIEGTRSRTGKMLPPKLGLLAYVADAYWQGRSADIALQPVSITFDQLHDVLEFASYARGAEKKPERFGWFLSYVRAQGTRRFGKVAVRFPEPVSMQEFLGPPGGPIAADPEARRLALQKTAFEVAWRINEATPVTAPALVTTILLAVRGVALTLEQLRWGLDDVLDFLDRKGSPTAGSVAALRTAGGVRAALDALSSGGPVTAITDGWEPVWRIGPDQQLAAAFYRNSIIHVFLDTAIGELALLRAAEAGPTETLGAFWAEALRLRDLLKFEFYFPDRETFGDRIAAELERHHPGWEHRVAGGAEGAPEVLDSLRPLMAPTVLRPFLEAYGIVADLLVAQNGPVDRGAVVRRALGVGRQYVAQRRVGSDEPVSALLFGTALQLADNQGLLRPAPGVAERRRAFRAELQAILRRIGEVEHRALRRFFAWSAAGAADGAGTGWHRPGAG